MRTTLTAAFVLLTAACGSDDKDQDNTTGSDAATMVITAKAEGDGEARLTGRVTRKVAISKLGDGVGVLHVGVADVCLAADGTAPVLIAVASDKVDLTDDAVKIPFAIENLSDGTYYASAWFDDVDNKEQDEDLPGKGDLAMFTKATPVCEEVVIKDGKSVSDLTLALNYEMPFDLTGRMGDEGVLPGSEDDQPDPVINHDDPNTYNVTFKLTRSVPPAEGGDGKGFGVFALSQKCFEASGSPPPPEYAIQVKDVDISADGSSQTLTIPGVKNGIYQLNGYLDDVGEHSDERPLPANGDLVRFGGFGPGCVKVIVNGADVESAYDLNFVMTWDLND